MASRFKQLYLALLSILFISLPSSAENETKLIIGYGSHNGAPYAFEKAESLHAGIIKDIVNEISAEIDIDILFMKVPRKRIERYLENNTIHLVLLSNPKWLNNSDKLQWSEPIFIEQDKMVVKATDNKPYQSISDFKNMIIGTIRGYKYPNLQPFFEKEYFIRYDVNNLEVNFLRLELNRIDALVDSDTLINYYLKHADNADVFKVLSVTVSKQQIRAALSPNSPISLRKFNQALQKLKEQGVIAAIMKKYQVSEPK